MYIAFKLLLESKTVDFHIRSFHEPPLLDRATLGGLYRVLLTCGTGTGARARQIGILNMFQPSTSRMRTNQSCEALGGTWGRLRMRAHKTSAPEMTPAFTPRMAEAARKRSPVENNNNNNLGCHLQDFGWVCRCLAHTRASTHCVERTRRRASGPEIRGSNSPLMRTSLNARIRVGSRT